MWAKRYDLQLCIHFMHSVQRTHKMAGSMRRFGRQLCFVQVKLFLTSNNAFSIAKVSSDNVQWQIINTNWEVCSEDGRGLFKISWNPSGETREIHDNPQSE